MKRPFTARTLVAALAVAASQALLAAAFAWARCGAGVAAAGLCALGWLVVLALAVPFAAACLAASLALAVLAVLAGAPGWLTTAAAAASLAAWDLTGVAGARARGVDGAAERRILASHLRALAAGILPGLALAGVLGEARIALPFPVLVAVAVGARVALDRAARRAG